MPQPSTSMATPKILVVDDQPINVQLLKRKLEREGMIVATSYSGREALDLVKADKPDLILLDVMMPEMDGYEVCRRLRADPQTARVPVLMFSAKGTSDDRRNGMLVGADDFVTKSVGPRALVARIRSLLSSSLSGTDSTPLPVTQL